METLSFKKATLLYIASKLPDKYIDDMRRAFIAIDINGDGKLEKSEFKVALDKIGVKYTDKEI